MQLLRLQRSLECLRHLRAVDIVVMHNGFPQLERMAFADNVLVRAVPTFPFKVRTAPDGETPFINNSIQNKPDSTCTPSKFNAWSLTAYEAVLLLDTDICIYDASSIPRLMSAFVRSSSPILAGAPEAPISRARVQHHDAKAKRAAVPQANLIDKARKMRGDASRYRSQGVWLVLEGLF